MSLIMTKQEGEAFLADVHIGIISIAEEGRGLAARPGRYYRWHRTFRLRQPVFQESAGTDLRRRKI